MTDAAPQAGTDAAAMPCPVRCVVVGVDGSEHAQRALRWTRALAEAVGAQIVAVHALSMLERIHGEKVPTAGHRDEVVARMESEWCGVLDGATVPVVRRCVDGSPVHAVLSAADECDADLIVVGARGLGGLPEQLLGSTSHQIAERARQPVVIIPPVRG